MIHSRLVVLQGTPPAEAVRYREGCMSLFMQDSSTTFTQKVLLATLPNGNWCNVQEVEYYASPDTVLTKPDIEQIIMSGLNFALCSHKPHIFPNHRWTGADKAVSDISKLECIHGLLTHTYKVFMTMMSKPASQPMPTTEDDEGPVLPVDARGPVGADIGEGAYHTGHHANEADASHTAEERPINVETRTAAENDADRRQASEWLSTPSKGVLDQLVILRSTMQPLVDLLYAQFRAGGEEQEVQERSHLAATLLAGHRVGGSGRSFMLTQAAAGQLETKFFEQVQGLFHNDNVWQLLDVTAYTTQTNALIFKLLCRQGALVEELIASQHRKPSIALFRGVEDEAAIQQWRAAKPCLLDSWSRQLLDAHNGLDESTLQQVLSLHAQLGSTSIAGVEARHASNRRLLHQRSVQTWSVDAATSSAEFLARCLRRSVAARRLSLPMSKRPRIGRRQVLTEAPPGTQPRTPPNPPKACSGQGHLGPTAACFTKVEHGTLVPATLQHTQTTHNPGCSPVRNPVRVRPTTMGDETCSAGPAGSASIKRTSSKPNPVGLFSPQAQQNTWRGFFLWFDS